jgi:hypothetical protein
MSDKLQFGDMSSGRHLESGYRLTQRAVARF